VDHQEAEAQDPKNGVAMMGELPALGRDLHVQGRPVPGALNHAAVGSSSNTRRPPAINKKYGDFNVRPNGRRRPLHERSAPPNESSTRDESEGSEGVRAEEVDVHSAVALAAPPWRRRRWAQFRERGERVHFV